MARRDSLAHYPREHNPLSLFSKYGVYAFDPFDSRDPSCCDPSCDFFAPVAVDADGIGMKRGTQ